MLEIFIYVIAGIALGIFSGLTPGIHLNTVCFFAAAFALHGDFNIVALIVSMSITHCFVDFIPSVFLGASDSTQNCASVLPGHRMFLEGNALEAVKLSCIGCLLGVFFSLMLSIVFVSFALQISGIFPKLIPAVICIVLLLMVFSEKTLLKKAMALFVILISGAVGFLSLNFSTQDSLLALVSGFFAAAGLLWSFFEKTSFKPQNTCEAFFEKKQTISAGFLGGIAGSIVALLPSIGPSEAALMVRKVAGEISTKSYLVLLGGISTANTVFGFFVLFFFSKARNGPAVAISQLIRLSESNFHALLAIIVFSAGISFFISVWLSKKALAFFQKINYSLANLAVLIFLSALVFAFSGLKGLLVFATASSIGFFAISSGVRRSNCMAFLMLPTLAFYISALINSS
ncbi:MAG: tripartite tricarboxylate transporter permease [Candidatus Diapherotrites archaeon]|nr:tripartite tricarboxylate transporter permease [Candidatus Diapherotrites archaeon]